MLRPEIFKPDLWFLAMDGEEIAGACLCFPYDTDGWVRQLGVAPRWRRRGLGSALLRHTFIEFQNRGFERVGLAVEGDNLKAFAVYERVGMKPLRQYDEYMKVIVKN